VAAVPGHRFFFAMHNQRFGCHLSYIVSCSDRLYKHCTVTFTGSLSVTALHSLRILPAQNTGPVFLLTLRMHQTLTFMPWSGTLCLFPALQYLLFCQCPFKQNQTSSENMSIWDQVCHHRGVWATLKSCQVN
jgi:hypothetical protein